MWILVISCTSYVWNAFCKDMFLIYHVLWICFLWVTKSSWSVWHTESLKSWIYNLFWPEQFCSFCFVLGFCLFFFFWGKSVWFSPFLFFQNKCARMCFLFKFAWMLLSEAFWIYLEICCCEKKATTRCERWWDMNNLINKW